MQSKHRFRFVIMLFRWFVGLAMDAPVWDASTFSKNSDRLLEGDVGQSLLAAVVAQPRVRALMSDEHFSVDGTLIQAWASHKSFQPKPEADSKAPPPATRNPQRRARLARAEAQQRDPSERHRSRCPARAQVERASEHPRLCRPRAHGEPQRAGGARDPDACDRNRRARGGSRPAVRPRARRQITLGADKGYHTVDFVAALRERRVTPHIAADRRVSKLGKVRRSAIDGRTTRHPGYDLSQRTRKRIEEVFGSIKASAGLRQTKHRGRARVGWSFTLATAAYNLIRLPKPLATAPA